VDVFCMAERASTLEVASIGLGLCSRGFYTKTKMLLLKESIYLRSIATNAHVMNNSGIARLYHPHQLTNPIRYTEPGGRILTGCRLAKSAKSGSTYTTPGRQSGTRNAAKSSNSSRVGALTQHRFGHWALYRRSCARGWPPDQSPIGFWVKGRGFRDLRARSGGKRK
jgi:hypothetical protein